MRRRLLDQLALALHELSRELAKRGLFLLCQVDWRAPHVFLQIVYHLIGKLGSVGPCLVFQRE